MARNPRSSSRERNDSSSNFDIRMTLAVLASFAFVYVSFFNTWRGMAGPVSDPLMAFFFTCGIIFLIWVFSWLMAEALSRGHRLAALSYFIGFFMAACVSVTFSYVSFYDTLVSRSKEREAVFADLKAQNVGIETVGVLSKKLEAKVDAASVAFMGSQSYSDWRANARKVADSATLYADQISTAWKAQWEDSSSKIENVQRSISAAEEKKKTAEEARRAAKSDAIQLEKSVDEQKAKVEPIKQAVELLNKEIADKKKNMELEEKKGCAEEYKKENCRGGKGLLYAKLQEQLKELETKLRPAKQSLDRESEALSTMTRDAASAQNRRQNADKQVNEFALQIDRARQELDALIRERDTLRGTGSDVQTAIFAFGDAVKKFEQKRKPESLLEAQSTCEAILQTFQKQRLPSPAVDCSANAFRESFTRLQSEISLNATFQKTCTGAEGASAFNGKPFTDSIALAKKCVEISRLIDDAQDVKANLIGGKTIAGLNDGIAQTEARFGPQRTKFDRAYIGLVDYREIQAYFALMLAFAVDGLVFVVLFAGRRMKDEASRREREEELARRTRTVNVTAAEGDSPRVALLKSAINALRPISKNRWELDTALLSNREALQGVINDLVAQSAARIRPGETAVFELDRLGYLLLKEALRESESRSGGEFGYGIMGGWLNDQPARDGEFAARFAEASAQANDPAAETPQDRSEEEEAPQEQPAPRRLRLLADD